MTAPKVLGLSLCTAFATAASVSCVMAQDSTPSDPTNSIDVDAGISVSEQFTDNVFLTPNDKTSDFITIISPWVDLSWRSEDVQLSFGASAEIGRFAENSSEDYEDYFLNADGLFRLSETTFVFGGLEYNLDHEDRNSPDDVNGLEPTEFRETSGYLGIGGRIRDNAFRLGVNIRDLDFDDTPAAGGAIINNDDRDRVETEIGGRIGIARRANGEVFLQGIYNMRDYDDAVDDLGSNRDSDGIEANIGYTGRLGNVSTELTFGVLSQDFDNPAFGTVTVPDFGAEVVWRPSPATRVIGIIDRSLEETTVAGASSYVSTAAGLRLSHRAAQDLSLASYFFLTENDYQGVDRKDLVAETGAELRYFISPRVYLDTGYQYQQRLSDVAGADYAEHRLYFTFGTNLQPNFEPRENAGLVARSGPGTFYIGTQVGHGVVQSSVDGPRGGGAGTLSAEFGDDGMVAGVLGGYRTQVGSMVLGIEADVEFSNQDWAHDANRDFSVKVGNTYGLSAIIGYRTPARNLVYGRIGAVATAFDSRYSRGGNQTARDDFVSGFAVGVGTEVPLGRGLSGRMEYQIRSYSDYALGAPLGGGSDDNFANSQSVARFGIVYELGAKDQSPVQVDPVDFSGAYVGGALGHGSLQSENSGPRPVAAAPAFFLNATRSGQGFNGAAFAGYGRQFGNFYVGAEAELEVSTLGWNIDRDPTGRVYSVNKEAGLNTMARVGYVVNNSVLLYGRAGWAVGRFDTDYTFGGTTFSQTDTLSGLRVGLGLEYPISPKLHLRMDYSYTDYGTHFVNYGAGVDRFESSENLFQVGLAYQF